MKKRKIKFAFAIFLFFLFTPFVFGKTVGDLKKEVKDLENKYNENQANVALTEEEMKKTKEQIAKTKEEISKANEEIQSIVEEIKKMEEDIKVKEKEMKSIVNFVQVANGESAYMEYIFGAKSFTDFIYRITVSEQMVDYNDKLVKEYHALIVKNNQKQEELKQKKIDLAKKQEELEVNMNKLGQKMETLNEGELDLKTQLKVQKEALNAYKGCSDNADIRSCGVPDGTHFSRPLKSGRVSSEYGWRFHPTQNVWRLHSGIDLSDSGSAVPVYPTANGKVVAIVERYRCGGNMIYIHHTINGAKYTSIYMHLRSINVRVGDIVNAQTVIATMGGDPRREYWDGCSTGQHLHFTLANGLYGIDYKAYEAYTFNPRKVLSFPGTGGSFVGR